MAVTWAFHYALASNSRTNLDINDCSFYGRRVKNVRRAASRESKRNDAVKKKNRRP